MRDYIILNGVNSNTITGLLISTLPPITKPKIRTQTEEIDGRDGDIVTKLGYSAYDKEIQIGLYGDFDIDDVIAYFNSEGTVTFSNEPDKFYNYQILDQIDYEKLIRFKTAKVKMHVQPFKYPLEETPVEISIQNVSGEGEATDLDNTAEAPLTLALNGNTSQNGTPTPTTPVEVDTTTGGQKINVCGKNLFDKDSGFRLGYINANGSFTSSNTTACFNQYIGVKPNTTYTISFSTNIASLGCPAYYNANQTFLSRESAVANVSKRTITTPNNCYFMVIQFNYNNSSTMTQEIINSVNCMVENGNQATAYEPYQKQSNEINLGKNLIDDTLRASAVNNVYIGTNSASATFPLKAGTYTISTNVSCLTQILDSSSVIFTPSSNTTTYTFTLTNNTDIRVRLQKQGLISSDIEWVQLEKGSTATTYAPYKTPIELCKIGDYQDRIYKDSGKWYIERKIGKVVLNGTETWNYYSVAQGNLFRTSISTASTDLDYILFSNYYLGISARNSSNRQNNNIYINNQLLDILDNRYTTTNDFKTWLASNNVTVYYVLTTPTTTEITDQELITQLEAINNARSYDPITHITQNTADKPFIINATAVQKGTDTGVVDNEGNIYSKPTIDIEGTGTAEIYLNNNQIFSVDLSTYNECIIDTTNLEAYNPATSQLMNRQVTGDYSNFKLNAGENQIKISGAVTKATITNYTRWL